MFLDAPDLTNMLLFSRIANIDTPLDNTHRMLCSIYDELLLLLFILNNYETCTSVCNDGNFTTYAHGFYFPALLIVTYYL